MTKPWREAVLRGPLPAPSPRGEPRLSVAQASTPAEVELAQRLRYKVVAEELGARIDGGAAGLDRDEFDDWCNHLIVRDDDRLRAVGTDRILPPHRARSLGRLYTEAEFDLARLAHLWPSMIEVGRAASTATTASRCAEDAVDRPGALHEGQRLPPPDRLRQRPAGRRRRGGKPRGCATSCCRTSSIPSTASFRGWHSRMPAWSARAPSRCRRWIGAICGWARGSAARRPGTRTSTAPTS